MKVLFVAGSHGQATYWANQLGFHRSEWQYVDRYSIRGHQNPTVFVVGTPHKLPGWHEVLMALWPAQPNLIDGEAMAPPHHLPGEAYAAMVRGLE